MTFQILEKNARRSQQLDLRSITTSKMIPSFFHLPSLDPTLGVCFSMKLLQVISVAIRVITIISGKNAIDSYNIIK